MSKGKKILDKWCEYSFIYSDSDNVIFKLTSKDCSLSSSNLRNVVKMHFNDGVTSVNITGKTSVIWGTPYFNIAREGLDSTSCEKEIRIEKHITYIE